VSKKASAPYRSGRVTTWLKLKSTAQGPFVVAGFIPSSVQKNAVGALVLAEHVDGKLTASGHVGSGFSAGDAAELWRRLEPLPVRSAPIRADLDAVLDGLFPYADHYPNFALLNVRGQYFYPGDPVPDEESGHGSPWPPAAFVCPTGDCR
jgi:ATP-dependent DNA ligase